jgi:hypothetical protein
MSDPERLDLRPIDPDADPEAGARFVDAVMARVAARPAPSALPADPLVGIWSLARSPAVAAGIVIAIAIGAIGLRVRGTSERTPQTIEQAVGVPAEFLAAFTPTPGSTDR